MPYEFVSITGELNYSLHIIYNNSNLVPKTVLVPGAPIATTQKVNYAQMLQEMSSIALWNPVESIVFASALPPMHPMQTSLPKDVGDNNNNYTNSGHNSNLLNTISDFCIAVN